MTDYKKRLYPRKCCNSHHKAGGGRFSGFDREPGTAQARFLGFCSRVSRGDRVHLTGLERGVGWGRVKARTSLPGS